MSKISIIGGDYIETTGGDNLLFAKGNIINSSELEVRQKGEGNGVSYGTNKEAPLISNYIEDAYWASDKGGNNKITEADLEDTVYFIIDFKEVAPDRNTIIFDLSALIDERFIWINLVPFYIPKKEEEINIVYITEDGSTDKKEEIYEKENIVNKRAVIYFKLSKKGVLTNLLKKKEYIELFKNKSP